MIDAHCHLNTSYTPESVSVALEHFTKQGGTYVIDVTTSLEDIPRSQAIIKKYSTAIYATIGLHPETPKADSVTQQKILSDFESLTTQLPTLKNIVGIGETGLDYYYFNEQTNESLVVKNQEELFRLHIALAEKLHLPLVIHARGRDTLDMTAYTDCLSIIKREHFTGKVYFHSFGGNLQTAEKILSENYYFGINGIITYKGSQQIADALEVIPLTSLLLETDAPFLIPSNMDRTLLTEKTINEPMAIFFSAKRLAAIKKIAIEEILQQTAKNTKAVFESLL
jgi:TatD DNase family protein